MINKIVSFCQYGLNGGIYYTMLQSVAVHTFGSFEHCGQVYCVGARRTSQFSVEEVTCHRKRYKGILGQNSKHI